MLPWGHAAVGYLLFAAYVRYRDGGGRSPGMGRPATGRSAVDSFGGRPDGVAVLVLLAGTQFADLVDKPLGWYLGVLPGGRSLAHSLLVAGVVLAVVLWLAGRLGRPALGVAFAVGHLSHLAADAVYPVLEGEWVDVYYLLWPVLQDPDPVTDATIIETMVSSTLSPTGVFEAVLLLLAAALWVADGTPGLAELDAAATTAAERLSAR